MIYDKLPESGIYTNCREEENAIGNDKEVHEIPG